MSRHPRMQQENSSILRNQLDDTAGLGDLLLRKLADVSGTDDDGDLRETALAKDLGVAEGEEVEDGGGVLLLALEVSLAGLGGDEGPELVDVYRRAPEVVELLVVVPHTNLTKVTIMVFIHVGTVVVLTTGQTTTTGMLPVLANSSLTGGHMSPVFPRLRESGRHSDGIIEK